VCMCSRRRYYRITENAKVRTQRHFALVLIPRDKRMGRKVSACRRAYDSQSMRIHTIFVGTGTDRSNGGKRVFQHRRVPKPLRSEPVGNP
jgi:hypothetical protein